MESVKFLLGKESALKKPPPLAGFLFNFAIKTPWGKGRFFWRGFWLCQTFFGFFCYRLPPAKALFAV